MSENKKNKIVSVSTEITAKASPNLEEIAYKAVAGLSEQDLIERNTIATLDESAEQSKPVELQRY